MKKLFFTLTVLLMGVVACSKSGKDEKKETKETEIKQEVNKTTAVSSSSIKSESSYETQILERMEAVKKEIQPALDSGVTADMNNAIQKLGDSWETEMKKVYELLLAELPENEKTKLQKEQEEWVKKVNTEPKEKKLEKTEKRAIEMARRYDKIHKK